SERNTIDLRGLQQGNYMVQITTNEWVSTQRVQVTR
ncbi:MAG: T9SS type A sorting domain-containing protein, partial [Flavobacteriales bacterium]|nr:T9SS type A sorting domain-containing protein [Flavobacteriales bacterium]MBL7956284.1 T9SS type A sorting domain-containing protein [Flavobacteriales bacterium]